MGKAYLAFIVALSAHDFLHDLNQHPPRIAAQICSRADHHFIAQGTQGAKALLFLPLFERIQQTQHGGSHAHFCRNGQVYDAVGVKGVGVRKGRRVFCTVQLNGAFDLREKNEVLFIEAKRKCHVVCPFGKWISEWSKCAAASRIWLQPAFAAEKKRPFRKKGALHGVMTGESYCNMRARAYPFTPRMEPLAATS